MRTGAGAGAGAGLGGPFEVELRWTSWGRVGGWGWGRASASWVRVGLGVDGCSNCRVIKAMIEVKAAVGAVVTLSR